MKYYNIQISEEQRMILLAAMTKYPKVDDAEQALLVDLTTLPDDQECAGPCAIIAFCDPDAIKTA